MKIAAVSEEADGTRVIRFVDGKRVELSTVDVRLLELAFHTHCPGCQHERGLVE